jgi:hypothetical protein
MLAPMKPFRIGAGAGYAGDRIDPAQALAERGALDALVFECLAERTIALAQLRRRREPTHGYDPLLQARMRAVLPACVAQGVRVISNMGAAHPEAAGAAVLAVARELGLKRLRVAVVTGDDVLPWVQAHDVALLDSTQRAADLGERLVSANAYLGADALLPALASGADVVITGRVADPALFLAPLMHAFGWRADDWPQLGQGVLSSAICWNARRRSAAATSPTPATSTCPTCTTWASRWPRSSPMARPSSPSSTGPAAA